MIRWLCTLLLPVIFLASCSSTSVKKKPTGGTLPLTHEAFMADPNYEISGDFWSSPVIEGRDPMNSVIEISLDKQRGYFYIKGELAMDFPVCTGKENQHETPLGNFRITEMKKDHRSSLYGSFVDKNGDVVKGGIRVTDSRPAGTHYRGAKLPYWMRFNGSYGIHEGEVWRKSASHGCVRIPIEVAEILFKKVECGTPVLIKN